MKQCYISVQEREMRKCSEESVSEMVTKTLKTKKEILILRFVTAICLWLVCIICEHFCVGRDYYLLPPSMAHYSILLETEEIYRQT